MIWQGTKNRMLLKEVLFLFTPNILFLQSSNTISFSLFWVHLQMLSKEQFGNYGVLAIGFSDTN